MVTPLNLDPSVTPLTPTSFPTPILIVIPYKSADGRRSNPMLLALELKDLKTIFQRALNTWSEVPPYLLELSDTLQDL
jgi:hypothetical protein